MNSFLKKIMGLTLITYSLIGCAQAKEVMAILSDNLRPVSTNYIIYTETSNLISQEISNEININGIIKALPVCNSISNSQKRDINEEVIRFVKEYQYTYNLNYDILRKISNKLDANYILLVSSGLDIETNFLKETFWSKIPIAGENSINPSYRIITQVTLIDPKNELILLEKNYNKSISSQDFDLAMPSFAPSPAQLCKLKKYSDYIAKNATPLIETEISPELVPVKRTFIDKIKFNTGAPQIEVKPSTSIPSGIGINPNPKAKLYNYVYDDL